jgi:hypothetical protein
MPVHAVKNLAEVQRAFKNVDRDVRLGWRKDIREIAEPVRAGAESNAVARIEKVGPQWSRMRVGITHNVIYVAPRKRGSRGGPLKRPEFADLLMVRAMEPALAEHGEEAARQIAQMVDRAVDRFNGSGF